MRSGLLLCIVAFALSAGSFAGSIADTDSDGIPDSYDNRISDSNGPLTLTNQCTTNQDGDEDGYGNSCDFDFNNDGATGLDDLSSILVAIGLIDPVRDINCDGAVGLDDLSIVLTDIGQVPGPSGLACSVANTKFTCPPL